MGDGGNQERGVMTNITLIAVKVDKVTFIGKTAR